LDFPLREIRLQDSHVALVDDEDYPLVSEYSWTAVRIQYTWYARANGSGVGNRPYMHSVITGFKLVDHQNRNGLDNQKHNLRKATKQQNAANAKIRTNNQSGFKGVYFNSAKQKFDAKVTVLLDGKIRQRKTSRKTALEAAVAYDELAKHYFGEYALTKEMLGLLEGR
jgi:hypothetical protein